MRVEESDKNSNYFDSYLVKAKEVLNIQIIKNYSFIAILIMFSLGFIEKYSKNKSYKTVSISQYLFIFGALIFAMITFDDSTIGLEFELSDYAHTYLRDY